MKKGSFVYGALFTGRVFIMKYTRILALLILASALSAQHGTTFGKITLPLGTVQVQKPGGDAVKAKPNMNVFAEETIITGARSRCEITLTGGGKVRIGENSELVLTSANIEPMKKEFNANLNKGNVWVAAKAAFGEKKEVSVRTPTAVAAIRGTKYRAKAGDDESSVLVYEGKVDVNAASNLIEKREEMKKSMAPGAPPGEVKFKLGEVQEISAPTQVSGPYEVTLEDWVSLVEGMQINVRKDGKFHMFEFDQTKDADLDFVKWNRELDAQ